MDRQIVTIELSRAHYRQLQRLARQAGKAPEALSREMLEQALQGDAGSPHAQRDAVRRALEAAGRARPASTPGDPVDDRALADVRRALAEAGGKPLSEIVLEQRGPRP